MTWDAGTPYDDLPQLPPRADLGTRMVQPGTVTSPAAREALRYRTALRRGFEELGDRPQDIARLLDNWSRFVNAESDLDPLVRMAVAHYQFEAIHPFTDGNGRTGRILNVLMLCDAGLLRLPVLYLSRYIIETKDEYYRLLVAVTADGAWEAWLRYMIEGVRATSLRTLALVGRISQVEADLVAAVRATPGTTDVALVAVLMERPYARTRDVIASCAVSRPTATKWLKALVRAHVLHEVRVGREVLYINVRLMEVLRTP